MSVKNNPTIGTCSCEYCDGTRSVHMYESGRHKGKLYSRCPSCAEQRHKFMWQGGKAAQALLRSKTTFKQGFEELAVVAVVESDPEPKQEQGVVGVSEPQTDPKQTPKPEPRRGKSGLLVAGIFGVILIVAGAAV